MHNHDGTITHRPHTITHRLATHRLATHRLRLHPTMHTAFDAQTLRVIVAACRGAPAILEAGVRRAHDVATIALNVDVGRLAGHRTRHRYAAHVDLECVGLARSPVAIGVRPSLGMGCVRMVKR